MKRIGWAASKIARGNLFVYNASVIFIACTLSFFIFVIAGLSLLFALILLNYISKEIFTYNFEQSRETIIFVCMVSLASVSSIFCLVAIVKNVRLRLAQDK